jgi:hypothetical protein
VRGRWLRAVLPLWAMTGRGTLPVQDAGSREDERRGLPTGLRDLVTVRSAEPEADPQQLRLEF